MQFCVSFFTLSLWSQSGSFQTLQSCQFLERSFYQPLPVVMQSCAANLEHQGEGFSEGEKSFLNM